MELKRWLKLKEAEVDIVDWMTTAGGTGNEFLSKGSKGKLENYLINSFGNGLFSCVVRSAARWPYQCNSHCHEDMRKRNWRAALPATDWALLQMTKKTNYSA